MRCCLLLIEKDNKNKDSDMFSSKRSKSCKVKSPGVTRRLLTLGLFTLAVGAGGCSADFSEFAGAAGGATGELICAVVGLLAECDP